MIALEVGDMQKTADYLRIRGVDIVRGQGSGRRIQRRRFATPTAATSSSGSGSGEPTVPARRAVEEASKVLYIFQTKAGRLPTRDRPKAIINRDGRVAEPLDLLQHGIGAQR
jgi:hypothetical protein